MVKPTEVEDLRKSPIVAGNLSTLDDIGKSIDIVMTEIRRLEREGYELIGPVHASLTNVYVYHMATLRLKV